MTSFKEKVLKIIEKVTARIISYLIAGAIVLFFIKKGHRYC